jgi:hypothetical protein
MRPHFLHSAVEDVSYAASGTGKQAELAGARGSGQELGNVQAMDDGRGLLIPMMAGSGQEDRALRLEMGESLPTRA